MEQKQINEPLLGNADQAQNDDINSRPVKTESHIAQNYFSTPISISRKDTVELNKLDNKPSSSHNLTSQAK